MSNAKPIDGDGADQPLGRRQPGERTGLSAWACYARAGDRVYFTVRLLRPSAGNLYFTMPVRFPARTRVIFGAATAAGSVRSPRPRVRRAPARRRSGHRRAGAVAAAREHARGRGPHRRHVPRLRREPRQRHGRGRPRSRRRFGVDAIVGFGGGSSLDCAKGINFLLTNGGKMADYRGYGKARDAAAADDRHPDHRRHRQRGAELRGHRRRRRRT